MPYAILIAVGTVLGIYWHKSKKKVQDKLGIDGNARKEVEEDIVTFESASKRQRIDHWQCPGYNKKYPPAWMQLHTGRYLLEHKHVCDLFY